MQGASKYLKTRLLITSDTAAQLAQTITRRRLCCVRVVNIARLIELIELLDQQASPGQLIQLYETALQQFEQQNFQASASPLAELFKQHPHDGPALVLLKRVVDALVDGVPLAHLHGILAGK